MKTMVSVVGAAVLGLGLATWANLAKGQAGPDRVAGAGDESSNSGTVHVLPAPSASPVTVALPPPTPIQGRWRLPAAKSR